MTEKIIEITPTPAGSIVTIYPTIEYKAVERRRREAAKRAARLAKVKSHAGGAALLAGLVLALGTAGGPRLRDNQPRARRGATRRLSRPRHYRQHRRGHFLLKPRRAFLYLIYKNSAFAALGPRAGLYRVLK